MVLRFRHLLRPGPGAVGLTAGSGPAGDEDGDLALGLLLVVGVGREDSDAPLPPGGALVAGDLADPDGEGLGAVLDHDLVGIGPEVVDPYRVLGRSAVGADQRVLAVVLDPHEGDLADVAALVAPHRDDDHRNAGIPQRVGFPAAGALIGLDLIADPAGGAGHVFALQRLRRRHHSPPDLTE